MTALLAVMGGAAESATWGNLTWCISAAVRVGASPLVGSGEAAPARPRASASVASATAGAGTLTLEALYTEHKTFVFATAFKYCGGRRDVAEDVTQAVFEKAHAFIAQLEPGLDVRGWLYRVTVHEAISQLRVESRWYRRTFDFLTARPKTAEPASVATSARQQTALAWQAISDMPSPDRVIAVLWLVEAQSQAKIARTLELSEATVSRAMQRVKQRLQAQGWNA